MPRIGLPELIIILIIALVVVGPGKLPSLGKSVGEAIKEFKKASTELMKETNTVDKAEETKTEAKTDDKSGKEI